MEAIEEWKKSNGFVRRRADKAPSMRGAAANSRNSAALNLSNVLLWEEVIAVTVGPLADIEKVSFKARRTPRGLWLVEAIKWDTTTTVRGMKF